MAKTPDASPSAGAASLLRQLGERIQHLSDEKVGVIAGLLDHGGHDPQALEGRAILRDRLRVLRPPRRMSPCRLFCVPFEMLLRDGSGPGDPLRPIARDVILPVWAFVEPRLTPDVRSAVVAAAAAATSFDDHALRAAGIAMWDEARLIIADSAPDLAGDAADPQWLRSMAAALDAHAPILGLRALLRGKSGIEPDAKLAAQIVTLIQAALRLGEAPAYAATVTAALHFSSPARVLGVLRKAGLGMRPGGGHPMVLRFCDAMLGDADRELVALEDDAESLGSLVESFEAVAESLSELTAVADRTKDPALRGRVLRLHGRARGMAAGLVLPRLRQGIDTLASGGAGRGGIERGLDCARRFGALLGVVPDLEALDRRLAAASAQSPASSRGSSAGSSA